MCTNYNLLTIDSPKRLIFWQHPRIILLFLSHPPRIISKSIIFAIIYYNVATFPFISHTIFVITSCDGFRTSFILVTFTTVLIVTNGF